MNKKITPGFEDFIINNFTPVFVGDEKGYMAKISRVFNMYIFVHRNKEVELLCKNKFTKWLAEIKLRKFPFICDSYEEPFAEYNTLLFFPDENTEIL